jgi:ribosomal-protein-alanine N-acetyltransferase
MSPDEVIVEEAGDADLDAVMRIMTDSFDPAFGEAWTAPQCAGLLPLPGVWLTVAREGDEVVGFSLIRIVADEAELLLLAVLPERGGRGIGKSLLQHFMNFAEARGVHHLHLEVRDGNEAIRLYDRAGFTVCGRRRAYYSGGNGQTYDALSLSQRRH